MEKFFTPKSIAVIGASAKSGKVGYSILYNLIFLKYKGKIFPVNKKGGEILGLKVYKSVKDLPKTDLIVIAVPAKFVPDIVKSCAKKGQKNIIIVSAGFNEIGEKGAKLENEIIEIAKKHNLKIIGPNCLGIINPHENLNASFSHGMPKKGDIAIVSQSGAMAVAIMDWAITKKFGFSKIISLGNKAVIRSSDIVKYLANDDETNTILVYIEDVKHGDIFMQNLKSVSKKKPIIMIKAGTSEEGKIAASLHTGALAGSNDALSTALKQCGIMQATNIQEFFDFAQIFSMCPEMKSKNVSIITNAGGPGIMTTDAVEKFGLKLAKLSKKTKKSLKEVLPDSASVNNPIDLIGDALADRYRKAIDIVMKDDNSDAIIVVLTPQIMTQANKTARVIFEMKHKYPDKIITASFIGEKKVRDAMNILSNSKIANFPYPERCVNAIKKRYEYFRFLKNKSKYDTIEKPIINQSQKNKIKDMIKNKKGMLSAEITKKILEIYKMPLIPEFTTNEKKLAIDFAKKAGYPLVAKISSIDILHKSDMGGVVLNIKNDDELAQAYDTIMTNTKKNCPNAKIDGVLFQKMIKQGKELMIGVKKDEIFSSMLVFGIGGIFVEVFKDLSFRIVPINKYEAKKMINEIKFIDILKGVRGEEGVNENLIIDLLIKTSFLAKDFPEIKELDFNPVIARKNDLFIADYKIVI